MPALTRWRPFQELEELRQRLDRVLEDTRAGSGEGWTLAVDLLSEEDRYVLRADVPGMKPEDVTIEIEDDLLTVSGHHEETEEAKRGEFVRRERRSGSFSRSMTLPKGVRAEDIEATCKDGVLEVSIPKAKQVEREKVTITPKAG